MKKTLPVMAALLCGVITGCGSIGVTSTSAFKLRMQAIYAQPVDASGSASPQSQTYLFKSLKLTKEDATEVELFSGPSVTYKVIDRPQMLYSNEDMTEYDGTVFTKAVVEFDPAVVITTKTGNALNLTLDTGTLELVENFTITKSKSQTLTIKTSWGKTITEDDAGNESASAPTFSMVYDDE